MKIVCMFPLILSLLASLAGVRAQPMEVAPGVWQLGAIQSSAVLESSGVVASRRNRGFFWTHNDHPADAVYAMTADGIVTNAIKIRNVQFEDWEDIAAAGSRLYL